MQILYPAIITGIIIFIFLACSSRGTVNQQARVLNDTVQKREFKIVNVPQDITVPQERANHLITHYWDNFDFNDTISLDSHQIIEPAFANYIEILPHGDKATSCLSISNMLSKAEKTSLRMYHYFLNLYTKYLYDLNSPLRNEELYIPVLHQLLESNNTTTTDRQRAEYILSLLLKNWVGEEATDITYTCPSGKLGKLSDIQASYTLLYFYNPDCLVCEEVSRYMKTSPDITRKTNSGLLKILAFYPDDDWEMWKSHLDEMPEIWIKGYDKARVVIEKQLYDLKAIPTLYLLDREKKVLLKDADITVIEAYIKDNTPLVLR